jgi:hypothetical protein
MKEINDERRTGSMLIPAWIEVSDHDNNEPTHLDPILQLLNPKLLGKRRAIQKKRKAKIVISAMVKAILDGNDNLIFFQRGRGKHNAYNYEIGHDAFMNIMDDLIENGYLIRVTDPTAFPVDNLAPRYQPSEGLMDLIPDQEIEFEELLSDLKHDQNDNLTYKPIQFTERTLSKSEISKGLKFKYGKTSQQEWDEVSEAVIRLRQDMSQHKYDGLIVNGKSVKFTPLYRKFISHIKNYGRYHSSFQSMSAKTRLETIRINNHVCCEIDIIASIPSVLHGIYNAKVGNNEFECIDYYQAVADLHPELSRKVVKAIFAASLGTGKLNTKTYPPKLKKDFPEIVKLLTWKDIRAAVLEGMPQIASLESRKMDWAYLNYRESEVLRVTMEKLLGQGIGVLPIHDSIIVPLKHRRIAKDIFSQAFFDELGVWPLIKVK